MNISPPRRFSSYRTNLAILVIVLGLLASLTPRCGRQVKAADISLSGCRLGTTRAEFQSRFGSPNFKKGNSPVRYMEYWAFKGRVAEDLEISLSNDRAYQLNGGVPEIDGVDVRAWTVEQITDRLGPPMKRTEHQTLCPEHGSRASCPTSCFYAVHSDHILERDPDQALLSYPEHHLLVRYEKRQGISFLLFRNP